jgi:MFS family permease
LQALSAIGNVTAALIFLSFGIAEEQGVVSSPWRFMFLVGALPALLALLIRRYLKEPEQWQRASHEGAITKQLGSYRELLGTPLWRKHALLGLVLASSGVIGLWAIGFFTPDLLRVVQRKGVADTAYSEKISAAREEGNTDEAEQLEFLRQRELNPESATKLTEEQAELQATVEPVISGRLSRWGAYTSLMINFGAFFGMFGFGALAQKIGRRPMFAIALLAACVSTATVFWFLKDYWQVFVLVPIMDFCQLSLFAGYAIYFPELFPTHLRSTGTSFCYNVGRFVAAVGPLIQASLIGMSPPTIHSVRISGVLMCSVFLVGLVVLPFLPETKDKPLPE